MSGNSESRRRKASAAKPKEKKAEAGNACDLKFEVDLTSVRPLFRQLTVGAVLNVELAEDNNLESVVCKRPIEGDVVGSLAAFEGLSQLIDCIRRGHQYVADVMRIVRATCTVRVRRVSTT